MTPQFRPEPVRVRTPATSANLGPGYDALGLAVSWYDDVVAGVGAGGLRVAVTGEGEALPRDEAHLVVRAMRATFDLLGGQPAGLELRCTNRIPHGRGLGSSAAAIVSGVRLARGLVLGGDELLPDDAAFAHAAALEGHPDNVAACWYGGLTIAWIDAAGTARAAQASVARGIVPVLLVPPFESSTEAARGMLPTVVPHADAAFAAARSALLVAVLTGRAPRADLLTATDDRLHQPYRAAAMPATAQLVGALRTAGLAAVVSGAGPTVLVLARGEVEVELIHDVVPDAWRCEVAGVDSSGARLVPAEPTPA